MKADGDRALAYHKKVKKVMIPAVARGSNATRASFRRKPKPRNLIFSSPIGHVTKGAFGFPLPRKGRNDEVERAGRSLHYFTVSARTSTDACVQDAVASLLALQAAASIRTGLLLLIGK